MIYFDNNATTRVFDSVVEAMRPFLTEDYANPASAYGHFLGLPRVIAEAKTRMAAQLGAYDGNQLVITSGATESNNLAIFGAVRRASARRHIVVSAIEHPSVIETVEQLGRDGFRITKVPVSRSGVVDLSLLSSVLSHDTLMVSVMLANNETGVIQPVGDISRLTKAYNPEILVHTDATQAVGKIPIDLEGQLSEIDLLSLSAHKFHGPKGVGALFVRNDGLISPIFFGGLQQNTRRPGTENVSGVIGMAAALDAVCGQLANPTGVEGLRNQIETELLERFPGAFALGGNVARVPATTNICLPGLDAEDLVDQLAARGVAVSTGSACAHGARKPSYVAAAMGLSYEEARSCIRISLSGESTKADAMTFLELMASTRNAGGPSAHEKQLDGLRL